MKSIITTLFICAAAVCSAYANSLNDSIAQPIRVTLNRHNASGEIFESSNADFGYYGDGKLKTFNYDDGTLGKSYYYDGDFLKEIRIKHGTEHPVYFDAFHYSYENGKLSSIDTQKAASGKWVKE